MSDAADRGRPRLPGRLGDPSAEYRTDDRAHRGLREMLAAFQLDGPREAPPVTPADGPEAVLGYVRGLDEGFEALYGVLPDQPTGVGVSRERLPVESRDGHTIDVDVFRPEDATDGSLPCVVYLHGGGMTILQADNGIHSRWCEDLAREGLVVARVSFRNAGGIGGHNPFPAGLHDCADAVRWITDNRDELGVSSVTLQGESGGANLCIATSLLAKREGWIESISGVHASVPYISGGYDWDEQRQIDELPSLVENDGWFLTCAMLASLAWTYTPDEADREDPLAWPYFATADDLVGLPPHVVTVNELDPLRDEGIAYARQLEAAGVPVVGRINLGIVHAAELVFKSAVPDINAHAVADIAAFARSAV